MAWKLAFSFAPCVRPENTRLDFYEIWSVLSKQAIWCHIKTEEETYFHPATQDYHFRSAQGIVIVIRVHCTVHCTLYNVRVWGLSGQNVASCSLRNLSFTYMCSGQRKSNLVKDIIGPASCRYLYICTILYYIIYMIYWYIKRWLPWWRSWQEWSCNKEQIINSKQ